MLQGDAGDLQHPGLLALQVEVFVCADRHQVEVFLNIQVTRGLNGNHGRVFRQCVLDRLLIQLPVGFRIPLCSQFS